MTEILVHLNLTSKVADKIPSPLAGISANLT